MSEEDDNAPDIQPEPGVAPSVWTYSTMNRMNCRTTVHTTEIVDGVLFVAVLIYGGDGRLEEKRLTRADMVRA